MRFENMPDSSPRGFLECLVSDDWIASLWSLNNFPQYDDGTLEGDLYRIYMDDDSGALYVAGLNEMTYDGVSEPDQTCIGKLETKVREWRWPIHNIAKYFRQFGHSKRYNCTIFDYTTIEFIEGREMQLRIIPHD